MVAVAQKAASNAGPGPPAWLPLVGLPAAAVWLAAEWPAWMLMWMLALSIYAALKWLSFADCVAGYETTAGRAAGYLLAWPGMDAKAFLGTDRVVERPASRQSIWATAKVALGLILFGAATMLVGSRPLIAGWIGMAGIVFTVHFGLFHLLSLAWRQAGVAAEPIMDNPLRSSSLADFWGRRWNRAFRDLGHRYIFWPLAGTAGATKATLAVFLVSGIIHDAVISIPAGAGFGLPTLYFLVQAVGLWVERSRFGKYLGLRKGTTGKLFCAAVILGPACLLFHRPFVTRVVVPMLVDMKSMWG